MIDTCPNTEQYAARKAEYIANMAVVNEYAPKLITDEMEITALINKILAENGLIGTEEPKGIIMKTVMPAFKGRADGKVINQIVAKLCQ